MTTALTGSLFAMATFLTFRCDVPGESVGGGESTRTYVPGAVIGFVELLSPAGPIVVLVASTHDTETERF